MTFSIVLAFTGYTLVTKTFPVLTLFFAVHEWSAAQIAVSLLCACHGCFLTAAALPFLLGQFDGLPVLPLGFAILCLNTPVCILLSCDPALEQAVRMLPGQALRFCPRYCVFLSFVNAAVSGVYLASWQWRYGGVDGPEIAAALLIALQSAILSVLLEWFCPIRSWKIESDLWQHPRKYVVPVVMLLLAGLIGIWPVSLWILFCAVLAEILILPKIARRI